MADNKMEKSIKEAIGKSLNGFNKKIGMAKLIKDNKNQDRIFNGILSQVNDENTEKTEKSNVITLDNSTDGIIELQEIKGDTNVNVSKIENETPITHVIDDKYGNVISLDGITEGSISIDNIQGNTMVNYCTDGSKELTLNGDIDVEGTFVTTTEGVDSGLVDVMCEGNTLVNLVDKMWDNTQPYYTIDENYITILDSETNHRQDYYTLSGGQLNLIKPNTTYTIIAEITKNTLQKKFTLINDYQANGGDITSDGVFVPIGFVGRYVGKFTTLSDFTNRNRLGFSAGKNNRGEITLRNNFIILEGDWTNRDIPASYFKGMKSVGQDDENGNKIEILSQNKNLFDNLISYPIEVTKRGGMTKNEGVLLGVIKVKPNTTYTMSATRDRNVGRIIAKMSNRLLTPSDLSSDISSQDAIYNFLRDNYASGRKFEQIISSQDYITFTTFDDCNYLYINVDASYRLNTGEKYIINNIQIEGGEVATPYQEHKQNKKEILLNEPLRALPNGVKDKIVIIDGKWYIERNCAKTIIDGTSQGRTNPTYLKENEFIMFTKVSDHPIKINNANLISASYKTYDNWGKLATASGEGISNVDNTLGIAIRISNNKTGITSSDTSAQLSEKLLKYFQANPVEVIYESKTPTYEPLDYNPFEVYSATTHISNNSNIPCNMKIKNTGYNTIIKPSTLYTIAIDTNKSGTIGMNLGGTKVTTTNNVAKITTPITLTDNNLVLYGKGIKVSNVRLLEGDKTNWIPSYFEGMESAFEQELVTDEKDKNYGKYKVNVKVVGKNLFNKDNIIIGKYQNCNIPTNNFNISDNPNYNITDFVPVKPNTQYIISGTDIKYHAYYDINKEPIRTIVTPNTSFTTPSNAYYMIFNIKSTDDLNKIQIEKGNIATEYEPHKENNITFYLKEPLRGIDENIKDRFCIKDGKLMIERNTIQYLLNGNEDYSLWGNTPKDGHIVFVLNNITTNDIKTIPSNSMQTTNFLCTQFPKTDVGGYNEGVQFYNRFHFNILKSKLETQDIEGFKKWISNNNIKLLCERKEPIYEEIKYSNNKLILDSYDNSTLIYNSNIPVSNTSFKPLWEELVYVKDSTTYYIQFNAIGNGNVVINLGGTELSTTITEGYNKIEITTPNKSTNLLTIDGQGIKISKVVVSEALCGGYYKGLQSCFEEHMENGKYVCTIRGIALDGSKVNGIKFYLNEPLRGIGDIKDRLCIKDNKLMVERKYGSIVFDGSKDENWLPTGYGGHVTRNTFEISLTTLNAYKGVVPSISNLFINERVSDIPVNDNAFSVYINKSNITYFLFTPSTDIIPYRNTTKWREFLQQNPTTVVYQLATSIYEEITNEYGLPIILEGYENGIVYVDSAVTPTTSIKYTSNNTVPTTLSNVDNLNTATQDDINNNIVTYMMDIDMMLTEMEMEDNASVMSLNNSDDNNQKHNRSHNNILDRMNKEDRIKYQDNTTKMLEKVIKGKSLTKEENINRIDLYLSEGKIREEQSNYLKELLKGVE